MGKKKKFNKPILSRMYIVNPKYRELLFLRLLLQHVIGSASYYALKIYSNATYDTFYETAVARKLVSTDEEWDMFKRSIAIKISL